MKYLSTDDISADEVLSTDDMSADEAGIYW